MQQIVLDPNYVAYSIYVGKSTGFWEPTPESQRICHTLLTDASAGVVFVPKHVKRGDTCTK